MKLLFVIVAAFALLAPSLVVAQGKKAPTAEECKKDPKMAGCSVKK